MDLISKYKPLFFGAILGAIGGYLYYFWIGCTGGSCPITSQPVASTIYGAILGGLFFGSFSPPDRKAKR